MKTIRFTKEHLEVFSAASLDRNPLHLSDEYARRTPYGGRVVFGVLNTLFAIGNAEVSDRLGTTISSVECEFFDVALLGVDYTVDTTGSGTDEVIIRVSDGRRPVLEVALTFKSGGTPHLVEQRKSAIAAETPLIFSAEELSVGRTASGVYHPSSGDLERLLSLAGVNQNWISIPHVAALMCSSYIVGMKIPGERALFSRVRLEFSDDSRVTSPFGYDAEIVEVSESGELTISGLLNSNGAQWATFVIAAHVRSDIPPASLESMERLSGRSDFLRGKVAFVTGGSRGLGASLVRALAFQGCTVILNFLRSQAEAVSLKNSLEGTSGRIDLIQGDAGDYSWCQEAQKQIRLEFGRLDFLFCNACPPLLPLWMEASAAERVSDFVQKSIAMVVHPMAAFLPMLAESRGWNVVISSTAVKRPHPYFPHYVVAKSATEALAEASSCEYRTVSFLTVRPPRLLTDLTNTPIGRRGALQPEVVAAATVRRIVAAPSPGKVTVLENFATPETH